MPWVPGYNSDRMSEIARLLIDLQRTRASEDTVALGLRLKDDASIFAVLVVRGNQVVGVRATGATPEEACRARRRRRPLGRCPLSRHEVRPAPRAGQRPPFLAGGGHRRRRMAGASGGAPAAGPRVSGTLSPPPPPTPTAPGASGP